MNLSKNFSYDEMVATKHEDLQQINKNYGRHPAVFRNLKALTKRILQPVRDELGRIDVHSGYRCPQLNKRVDGVDNSQHLFAEAADISSPKYSLEEIFIWVIKDSGIEYGQVILKPDLVHISFPKMYKETCVAMRTTQVDGKLIYVKCN